MTNVVHIDGNSDIILLHDHSILAIVDKDKELPEASSKLFYSDRHSFSLQLWFSRDCELKDGSNTCLRAQDVKEV